MNCEKRSRKTFISCRLVNVFVLFRGSSKHSHEHIFLQFFGDNHTEREIVDSAPRTPLINTNRVNSKLPIACLLTDSQLQERRRDVLRKVRGAITEIQEIDNGFRYRFSAAEDRLAELASLVEFEHKCCPFLTFRITVEPGDGPIWLELSGPHGAKEFLADLFN